MVALKPIFAVLLRAAFRRFFSTGSASKGAGVTLLFLFLLFKVGWFRALVAEAGYRISLGESAQAGQLLNMLLSVWVCLPLLLKSGGFDVDTVVRLRRLPLRLPQIFVLGAMDLITAPLFWVLLIATCALAPLVHLAPAGIWAWPAFCQFLLICAGCMLTVTHCLLLVGVSPRMRLPVFCLAVSVGLLMVGFGSPADLFLNALLSEGVSLLLLLMCLLCIGLTMGSFRLFLAMLRRENGIPALPTRRVKRPPLSGRFGYFYGFGIVQRLWGLSLFGSLAVTIGILTELLTNPNPVSQPFWVAITLIAAMSAPSWFNLFGAEGAGLMRIHLWPVSGARILVVMHLCTLPVTLLPIVPILIVGGGVFGALTAFCGMLMVVGLLLILAGSGTSTSISDPVPQSFMRNQRGITDNVPKIVMTGCALLAWMLLAMMGFRHNPWTAVAVLGLLDLLGLVVYRRMLAHQGRRFENSAEWFYNAWVLRDCR